MRKDSKAFRCFSFFSVKTAHYSAGVVILNLSLPIVLLFCPLTDRLCWRICAHAPVRETDAQMVRCEHLRRVHIWPRVLAFSRDCEAGSLQRGVFPFRMKEDPH